MWTTGKVLRDLICALFDFRGLLLISPIVVLVSADAPWLYWLLYGLFAFFMIGTYAAIYAGFTDPSDRAITDWEEPARLPKWAHLNPRACKKCPDERYTAPGRSAADGRLANPVRSGRKQP